MKAQVFCLLLNGYHLNNGNNLLLNFSLTMMFDKIFHEIN